MSISLTVHSQQTLNFLKLPLSPLNQSNLFLNYCLFTSADRHHTGKGQSESGTQPKHKEHTDEFIISTFNFNMLNRVLQQRINLYGFRNGAAIKCEYIIGAKHVS